MVDQRISDRKIFHRIGKKMWPSILTFPLGITIGLILVFTHSSFKSKGLGAKIAIAFLAGFGVFILLNAAVELLAL
jgi:hypothetical protein